MQSLLIKNGGGTEVLPVSEILYMESRGRVQLIHGMKGDRVYSGKLSELEKNFEEDFFRVHRSFLVNMSHVRNYDTAEVLMSDGSRIPMSKRRYSAFAKRYKDYAKGAGKGA